MKELLKYDDEKADAANLNKSVEALLEKEAELIGEAQGLTPDSIQAGMLLLRAKRLLDECSMVADDAKKKEEDSPYYATAVFTVSQIKGRLENLTATLQNASEKLDLAEDLGDKAKETKALNSFREALREQ